MTKLASVPLAGAAPTSCIEFSHSANGMQSVPAIEIFAPPTNVTATSMDALEIAASRHLRSQQGAMKPIRTAHFVGICGSGMRALAELLADAGWQITGSDMQRTVGAAESLLRRRFRVHQGHSPGYVGPDADLLIYSQAVPVSNPERRQASRLSIPQWSYNQMLGALMRDRQGVSIAGTHGKSTTTAMVGRMLSVAGRSPSVVCGAELCDLHTSGWAGSGPHFVVESCEYRESFLNLAPTWAVILNIEADHFDCFPSLEDGIQAYARFCSQVAEDGLLLVPGECSAARYASTNATCRVETFSLAPGSDWWATNIRTSAFGSRCRLFYQGEFLTELLLGIPGRHNVKNALAAAALCCRLGLSPGEIREGLSEFQGVRRRFEIMGSWKGMTLIDDYAHHPTAVRATLRTARERFLGRRIWCVFQPHQVSRTVALMDEFASSFEEVDEVLVAPVYAAREALEHEPEATSRLLAARIEKNGPPCRFRASLDHIVATLDDEAQPGDVLITMGAGDVNQVHYEFARRLQRDHSKG